MVTTLNKNICHFSHYWEYSFWFVLAAISWWNIADTSEGNGEIEFCQIANPDFCLRQVSAAVSVPVSIVVWAPVVSKTMSKSAGKSFFYIFQTLAFLATPVLRYSMEFTQFRSVSLTKWDSFS